METIHNHDVVAERFGTTGEVRAELERGERLARHTELREWLSVGGVRPRTTCASSSGLLARSCALSPVVKGFSR